MEMWEGHDISFIALQVRALRTMIGRVAVKRHNSGNSPIRSLRQIFTMTGTKSRKRREGNESDRTYIP